MFTGGTAKSQFVSKITTEISFQKEIVTSPSSLNEASYQPIVVFFIIFEGFEILQLGIWFFRTVPEPFFCKSTYEYIERKEIIEENSMIYRIRNCFQQNS